MQAVFCQVFENCFSEYVTTTTPAASTFRETDVVLTVDELNALRYACGYVSHRLLKKFEKRKGDKFRQFVHCLGEMAVVGEGGDVLAYTHKWLSLVNRGGFFPLNDNTFTFFVEVEKCVRVYLRKHVLASSADGESFKQARCTSMSNKQ